MKTCGRCDAEKPASDFYARTKSHDGLMACCKACSSHLSKRRYASSDEIKKATIAKSKEWVRNNPERAREIQAKSAETRPKLSSEVACARAQQYRARHPEAVKAMGVRRAAVKRRAAADQTTELDTFVELEALRLREARKFHTGINWHIDHIVPLLGKKASGLHNAYNLAVVPAVYNLRKNNRFNEQMLTRQDWLYARV